MKYEEAALNSAGTASEKFAIYQNSIEAAQERVKVAFEKFAQTLIDGGIIKGLSQIAEKAIDVLSFLAQARPYLQGIIQSLLVFKSLRIVASIVSGGEALQKLKEKLTNHTKAIKDALKWRTLLAQSSKMNKEADEASERAIRATEEATKLRQQADELAALAKFDNTKALEAGTVAEKAAGAEKQALKLKEEALTAATEAQTVATKASTAAINFWVAIVTIAITAIATVARVIEQERQAHLRNSETAREASKQYKETANSVKKLGDEYLELSKKITLSQEDIDKQKELQDQLLDYAKEINLPENTRIDIINLQNKSYSEQLGIIKQIHSEAVQMSEDEAKEAVVEAKRGMKTIGANAGGAYGIIGIGGAPDELELMTQRGFVFDTSYGQFLLEGKFADSADATAQAYLRLIDVKKQLERELTTDELKDSPLYKSIGMWMKDFEEGAKGYIATYQTLAQSSSYVQEAIKSTNVTDEASLDELIKNVQQKARDAGEDSEVYLQAIDTYLRSIYADAIAKSKQDTDDGTKANTAFKESFGSLQKELTKVRGAFDTLNSAINEYTQNGYISVDTFEKLLSTYPEYLKYLFDENGHIQDNTDALKENIKLKIYSEALASANDLINKVEAGDLSVLTNAIEKDTKARQENINAQLKELYVKINALGISEKQKKQLWAEVGYRLKLAEATASSLDSTKSATSSEDKYAKAVKYAQQVLQNKIDALKKEKEAIEKRNEEAQKEIDLMDKALSYAKDLASEKVSALEAEKQALKDKNSEKEKELELQKLEENLANAKRRKVRVYRQDIDKWVWQSDESEVAEAEKALEDFKLQQQTEAIDAEIKKWNEYIEKLGEVTTVYETEQKKLAFEQMSQYITQGGVNNRNLKQLEEFAKAYAKKQRQIANNTTDEIDKQIEKYEELKDKWGQIKTDYENAEDARIGYQLLGAQAEEAILNGRLDTYEEFKKKYDAYLDGQADKASSTATSVKNSLSEIMKAFGEFEDFEDTKYDDSKLWRNWIERFGGRSISEDKMIAGIKYLQGLNNQGKLLSREDIQAAVGEFLSTINGGSSSHTSSSGSTHGGGGGRVVYNKWTQQKYASGTKSSPRGIALTDENGLELRIPNKGNLRFLKEGTGVLPNNLTERVFAMASNPVSYARKVAESMSSKTTNNANRVISIGNITLPNVKDGESFVKELEIITQNR